MLNRRNILAGGAAIIGTGLPALATPSAPDAELLALGAEFSAILPAYGEADRENRRLHEVWQRALASRGLSLVHSGQEIWLVSDEIGYTEAAARMNAHCDRLCHLSRQIRRLQPTTLAGLAAWAAAALFEFNELGAEIKLSDFDGRERPMLDLAAHIERMAVEGRQ